MVGCPRTKDRCALLVREELQAAYRGFRRRDRGIEQTHQPRRQRLCCRTFEQVVRVFQHAPDPQRAAGAYLCFAVTVKGFDTAIGIFQIRETEPGFGTAEWGFAIGSPFWGTGVFQEGAQLVVDFAFETVGVHRLEARSAVRNGRGNGALQKIGAVKEGVLRKSFVRNGEQLDQVLWAILDEDWLQAKKIWECVIH